MSLYVFHWHRVCLVDHVDLICSLYLMGRLWVFFLVSAVVLFPPLHVGRPQGFAPEAALEGLGLPL